MTHEETTERLVSLGIDRAKAENRQLAGAALYGVDLAGADLVNANLARANLYGADLSGTNVSCADLACANLTSANLTSANLAGADLSGANCAGSNLSNANLRGARLLRAKLAGARADGGLQVSRPPIMILGLRWPVIITDACIRIGRELHSAEDWEAFDDTRIAKVYDGALEFWRAYKAAIMALAGLDWLDANQEEAAHHLVRSTLRDAGRVSANLVWVSAGKRIPLTREPVQVFGLCWPVIIMDAHIQIGCEVHSVEAWVSFSDARIAEMDSLALRFWRAHKATIMALAAGHCDK